MTSMIDKPATMNPLRYLFLVDDDELVAMTISGMTEEQFQTTILTTVAEAIAALANPELPRPHVILLDCVLPGGNIPALLAEADRLGVPVVLMSGDPRQAEAVDQKRKFMAKPFQQADLLAALNAVG